MIETLRRPLSPLALIAVSLGAAVAVALYCLAYSRLAGSPETVGESLGWALVNILPWVPTIEFAKRASGWGGVVVALAAGFAGSLGLGFVLDSASGSLGFEAWRRAPSLVAIGAAMAAIRWTSRKSNAAADPLPLLPRQIEWVRAAGNYVELRANGRTIIHRASLGAAERELETHDFVRIHRSTLVRRDRIARVRPDDVILHDGTHLKIGKRFRTALDS